MSAYNGPERRNPRTFPVPVDEVLQAVRTRAAEVAIDEALRRLDDWAQGLEEGAMAIAAEAAAVVRGTK